ncbi:hypothetical protein [Nocardia sp. NBC_01009]|uniref:hypothetical protein n=1 Tax=Nocardia sp. NBC_01009 TaxID=2975996 RepID=UPI003862E1F0|nr:hypothetical protein OHA42_23495 [Nocardia sp. NBC_01009]
MFRYLPRQPGYNKRINAAGPLIADTVQRLAALVSAGTDEFRFIDATPIPCGTSVPTRKRSELAGLANYGYCAPLSRWYWGVKPCLITTAHGMPVACDGRDSGESLASSGLYGSARMPDGGSTAEKCSATTVSSVLNVAVSRDTYGSLTEFLR